MALVRVTLKKIQVVWMMPISLGHKTGRLRLRCACLFFVGWEDIKRKKHPRSLTTRAVKI